MAAGRKTGGRKKGTPNRVSGEVREMILAALDHGPGGGVAYLIRQRELHPAAFLALLRKLIPRDVSVSGLTEIHVVTGMEPMIGEPGQHPRVRAEPGDDPLGFFPGSTRPFHET